MKHELKTLPEYFKAVKSGEKRFEVRKNDRKFTVGDLLELYEWDDGSATGNRITVIVTYILSGKYGVHSDYCVMSILRLDKISD